MRCPGCGEELCRGSDLGLAWWVECGLCGVGVSGEGDEVVGVRVENHLGMKYWVPVWCMWVGGPEEVM